MGLTILLSHILSEHRHKMPLWHCSATRANVHIITRHQYNPALSNKTFRRAVVIDIVATISILSILKAAPPLAPTLSILCVAIATRFKELFGLPMRLIAP